MSEKKDPVLVKASVSFTRQTARKVRRCVNLLRNMTAGEAVTQLKFLPYAAATPVRKLIESAMANAEHNFNVEDAKALKISEILVDDKVIYKRWRAVSRGRGHKILKRSSQISLVLSELAPAEFGKYKWDSSKRNPKNWKAKKEAANKTEKKSTKKEEVKA